MPCCVAADPLAAFLTFMVIPFGSLARIVRAFADHRPRRDEKIRDPTIARRIADP